MRSISNPKGIIFRVSRSSAEDGPGIRTTVFLKGCPLRCLWCHSPQSQSSEPQLAFFRQRCICCGECTKICPQGAQLLSLGERFVIWDKCDNCGICAEICPSRALEMVGTYLTAEEVVGLVKTDLTYYEISNGGVTFSGGEPTMQPDFLVSAMHKCKVMGIHTVLDTCGFASWSVFEAILPNVDLFLYDIKHMDSVIHEQYTGVSNELILQNLKTIDEHGGTTWIRIPLIPGFNDSVEDLVHIGEFASTLRGLQRVSLLPYNSAAGAGYPAIGRAYELNHLGVYPQERLYALRAVLEDMGLELNITN